MRPEESGKGPLNSSGSTVGEGAPTTSPLVSIIISNYNGAAYLGRSIPSLLKLDYPAVEIVIVDAGSTDGSAEIVIEKFPHVKLLREGYMGIGKALNIGITRSSGELLLLEYNSDEVATPSFLTTLVDALASSPDVGAVGGTRIVEGSDHEIDSMGGRMYFFGYFPKLGAGQNYYEISHEPFEVDYLGSMLVRRQVVDEIGPFDEDLDIYGEDSDFCWRIKKAGYRVLQIPVAVTYHVVGGTIGRRSPRYVYYLERAQMRLMLKHCALPLLPVGFVWWALLTIFHMALRFSIFKSLLRTTRLSHLTYRGDRTHLRAFLDAIFWNLTNLESALRSRRSLRGSFRDR